MVAPMMGWLPPRTFPERAASEVMELELDWIAPQPAGRSERAAKAAMAVTHEPATPTDGHVRLQRSG